jgi:hypothetical protein
LEADAVTEHLDLEFQGLTEARRNAKARKKGKEGKEGKEGRELLSVPVLFPDELNFLTNLADGLAPDEVSRLTQPLAERARQVLRNRRGNKE